MIVPALVSCRAVSSSSRTCAWMVTSSAVVGSSAMRTSGSFAIDIAIMTRWRIPPENSCGYAFARWAAFGMPTASSSSTARAKPAALETPRCTCTVSAIWSPIE